MVVEDGTGLATADSFVSEADAGAYHTARGNSAWASFSSTHPQLLIRATDFMQRTYAGRWAGTRLTVTQALDWPRLSVPVKDAPSLTYWPSDAVPAVVRNACAEAALLMATNPDLFAAYTEAQVKQEVVGPISVTYADGARQEPRFIAIDRMLSAFFANSGNTIRVVRA